MKLSAEGEVHRRVRGMTTEEVCRHLQSVTSFQHPNWIVGGNVDDDAVMSSLRLSECSAREWLVALALCGEVDLTSDLDS